jgi:pyruvate dehydrogenase E2 component (dihydrolipoamide acetyltransferase)
MAAVGAADRKGERIAASPLARRLAQQAGLDLSRLAGSGPHGRIIKRDIEAATAGIGSASSTGNGRQEIATMARAPRSEAPSLPDAKILALYDKGTYELVPHDKMRKVIAERLTLAKQTIPHYYLSIDCRLDELLRARERMNAAAPREGPRAFRLSVNDFLIKALALALQEVPAANATWTEGGMLRHKYSDVGVAVAVDGGLFTPVVHQAEAKSLSEISNEMRDLADRARKRRLAPHEYQGGTTSISNLGMYGIKSFDAVINPPHATILAVGAAEARAIVADNRVEAATVMDVTLSCDHRVVDGATGAALLAAFKAFIEDPVRMLV